MREIKFRAWFNGKRKMVYNLGFDDRSFTTLDDQTLEEDEMPSVWDKDCIIDDSYYEGAFSFELMQYTGMKDKNGKEIYEGDILGVINAPSTYLIEWNKEYGCYTSINTATENYDGGIFEQIAFFLLSNMRLDRCEIIGNIHENPELLEGR